MEIVLEVQGLSKSFAENKVLDRVDFVVKRGEIHALLGENGAGKSTLMKICTGLYRPDEGEILVDGEAVSFGSVLDAQLSGVALIHQEPRLFPDLNVLENIWVDYRGKDRRFSLKKVEKQTRGYLDELGCKVPLKARMADVSVAEQQLIDVASALRKELKVLVVDEPTASLTPKEVERLFGVLRRLRDQGVGIVFIGHRLTEILDIADRVTVLRDGVVVGEKVTSATNEDELARMMVGRDLEAFSARGQHLVGDTVLDVEDLSAPGVFRNVSFEVKAGEIVGIGGLVGAGRSQVLEAIFGIRRTTTGTVQVGGKKLKSVADAIDRGVALVPEDRAHDGLVLAATVQDNIVSANLPRTTTLRFRRLGSERSLAAEMISQLRVKTSTPKNPAGSLSGGNQQKLSLAKWLPHDLKLLLVDEPTRGVDVGSKAEIHSILRRLADEGVAVVMVSSDMRELLQVPDRVLVMREGEIVGGVTGEELTEERVIALASGVVTA